MSSSFILFLFPLPKISEANRNFQEKALPGVCLKAFLFETSLFSILKLRGWHEGGSGGLSRYKKIDPRAIVVEVAGCQRGGGVKVNKIDPCAIKTSLA